MIKYIICVLCVLFASAVNAGDYDPSTLVYPPKSHSMGYHKATPFFIKILLGIPSIKVNNPQGLATVRLRSTDEPKNTKDDDEVTVYGVNSGTHQFLYNKELKEIKYYGKFGRGDGNFWWPRGVAVCPAERSTRWRERRGSIVPWKAARAS